jgi:hypothetical protein
MQRSKNLKESGVEQGDKRSRRWILGNKIGDLYTPKWLTDSENDRRVAGGWKSEESTNI